jgi:hypothetical protein
LLQNVAFLDAVLLQQQKNSMTGEEQRAALELRRSVGER